MSKITESQPVTIRCRDPYFSYDAYHITAEFLPQAVRAGQIRQESDAQMDALVTISAGDQEIFRFDAGTNHDRKQVKYEMGCALYETFTDLTGQSLPWGILTGVRPTKIARRWLDQGMDEAACIRRFEDELKVSPARAQLAVSVAGRESALIRKIQRTGDRPLSLYIHIPFCPSRCHYCSFASVPADRFGKRIDGYLDALECEIAAVAPLLSERPVTCLYIGGGTPTVLNEEQLARLCQMVTDHFGTGFTEWTVEAGRPDTISDEKLEIMKDAGVSRISINPQTMHNETLERIGRGHTAEQVREAFGKARAAGFDNINMDLITGLSGEDLFDFTETLQAVGELCPDSVTVHALAVKRASKIGQDKEIPLPEGSLMTAMADEAYAWAEREGLEPYYLYRQKNMSGNGENIGFAKPGKEGLYNILIMEEVQDIIAFGAGAVTKLISGPDGAAITRVNNVKDVLLYMEQVDEMIKRKEESLC